MNQTKSVSKPVEEKSEALELLLAALERAKKKHPVFPGGQRAVSIITEEFLEMTRELNDFPEIYKAPEEKKVAKERQLAEALDLGVTVFRFIERLQKELKWKAY